MLKLKSLFQPLKLGTTTLRNRVFMSPLTWNHAVPRTSPIVSTPSTRRRGAGLIVMEGILTAQQG
ncbi:hypothetical protein ARMGADRAFT_938418 [Armillaria gallica]|uniref:NADH:flavin oxidoreductase/NADH oxidase N-terminal domain-containing protein n=1 Tax=Armillaria gallica TaxID=47427 RepID=A0A2H3DJX2_ARMGA|nr:hypothetical protein ARMGADRAFT_938418 [Armillaria gallica]